MILDQFKLDGRVALVTGACTGLGQGMALALAEAGANIVAVHHRHAALRPDLTEEVIVNAINLV